ncbi:transcriptional regulator [Brevibacillus reuszeri]|uniref:Transcriptional regulator n=1 Tax=Brevibacillus reuszeri TaxID=54915 RepID=A0A0K9YTP9_9BACL|nr:diacylglycerol kinase family protein [Brevibacillus reuszeri]KNB72083.1 hypothetical protein ADS79_21885 [Brevibacillus reuszeri]MED1855775.1 diacylglycerol kinase family lipid kinase [Brevibacillus reuszeri]GED67075.1 transcriptional regulator [Brevibacillus reuszeri]
MMGFIVNPVSGNGKGKKVWELLEPTLRGQGARFLMRQTSRQGEAQKLAIELIQKEGVKKLIAVGGDGTVHEVINGIQQSGQTCVFGHVAAGSGNDYARGHGVPFDPLEALEGILSDQDERLIDLLYINGRVAVNSIGTGLDALVAKKTNEARYKGWLNRYRLGRVAYIISVIRVLCSYCPCHVTLTVDNQKYSIPNAWLIALANIPNYGGGMLICPDAAPDDGEMKICVIHSLSRLQFLLAFPKIFRGTHVSHSGVLFYSGRQVQIQAEKSLFVHADGELVGKTPVNIELLAARQAICDATDPIQSGQRKRVPV